MADPIWLPTSVVNAGTTRELCLMIWLITKYLSKSENTKMRIQYDARVFLFYCKRLKFENGGCFLLILNKFALNL